MVWIWLGIAVLVSLPTMLLLFLVGLYFYLRWYYLDTLIRIFQEKPLFFSTRGEPDPEAEEVTFRSRDGLRLHGCYLRAFAPRRGVILFGLEFGSNRWACLPYCDHLRRAGYDIFTYEPRNQGSSESDPNYDPMQWVTDLDLADMRAAIGYLKKRPDADPRGIGLFGVSKGGSVGLLAAADDPFVRCVITDGAFGTYSVMVPYMRKWFGIYNQNHKTHGLLPASYYGLVALAGMKRVESLRQVRFPWVEDAMRHLRQPLLMIHGEADRYIKVEMARTIFARAAGPKQFWVVPTAKHNLALQVAGIDYHERVQQFFDQFLGALELDLVPSLHPFPLPSPLPTLAAE